MTTISIIGKGNMGTAIGGIVYPKQTCPGSTWSSAWRTGSRPTFTRRPVR